jgi:hypothetical protein
LGSRRMLLHAPCSSAPRSARLERRQPLPPFDAAPSAGGAAPERGRILSLLPQPPSSTTAASFLYRSRWRCGSMTAEAAADADRRRCRRRTGKEQARLRPPSTESNPVRGSARRCRRRGQSPCVDARKRARCRAWNSPDLWPQLARWRGAPSRRGWTVFELWWQPLEAEQCGQNLHFLHVQIGSAALAADGLKSSSPAAVFVIAENSG